MRADQDLARCVREAVPRMIALYAFGSVVDGTARPDSDLDLAVLAAGPIDAGVLFELRGRLADIACRDVDLIDLFSSSTVLRMRVVATGEILCVEDDAQRVRFEDLAFSMYARLNEERHSVLDRVSGEGRVYGR